MDNFHYRKPQTNNPDQKSTKLLTELRKIQQQLSQDHKKLAEKRKLQAEFYEDQNKLNLADEIMNQLLNQRQQKPLNKNIKIQAPSQNNNAQPIRQNQTKDEKQVRYQNLIHSPPKMNQFINVRQIQKMKLQNQNARHQFPFGADSRQKDRRINMQYDRKNSPQKQYHLQNNYIKPAAKQNPKVENFENPFLKNQQLIKQKRQQQLRNHRRLILQQMQQQKRKKEYIKQKIKQQQRQNYNNYTPLSGQVPNNQPKQNNDINMMAKKKRDPNAQHVPFQKQSSQIRPSDIEFMKLKVTELKNKFKKRSITHEQYEQQTKKLQRHYKYKISDLFFEEDAVAYVNQKSNQQKQAQVAQNANRIASDRSNQEQISMSNKHDDNQIKNKSTPQSENMSNHYNNISAPVESIYQKNMHQSQHPNAENLNFNNMNHSQQQNDGQMQIFFKFFQEFKTLFKMQNQASLNEKKMLQETIQKIIPNVNPLILTQQAHSSQMPNLPRDYQTEVKKYEKLQSKAGPPYAEYSIPNVNANSQSEISSSYIEKSLSGIVNKIPLTKKQKQQDKNESINKDIMKFYQKKYKVKKFKGFQFTQDDRNPNVVIPNISNFLQAKNSQQQLNQVFQQDLRNYKKLQKQKDMITLIEKLKGKKDYRDSNQSNQNIKKTEYNSKVIKNNFLNQEENIQKIKKDKQGNKQIANPFLKKHVSGEQYKTNNQNNTNFPKIQFGIPGISSPTPKSNEILQQQQYQTEPKKSDSPKNRGQPIQYKNYQIMNNYSGAGHQAKNYQNQERKEGKQYASSKILNIMKVNNEMLAKYELTPSHSQAKIGSNSLSSIKQNVRIQSSKQISSRQYFSGHDISPVQRKQYQSSLETVRSQQESAKLDRKNNMDLLMRSAERSSFNEYRSPTTQYVAQYASPTIDSIQMDRHPEVSANRNSDINNQNQNSSGYCQTIESIDENSSKMPSFNRPPQNVSRKGGRSVSRKKQSIIKVNGNQSHQKSENSSKSHEQVSRQLSSRYQQQKSLTNVSNPKFDSNVYESQYEQSVGTGSRNINIPNSFKQVLKMQNIQKTEEVKQNKQKNQDVNRIAEQSKNYLNIVNPPKWKSLQQARKLAKQFKQKSGEQQNRSSVQQKLSELQSFIHTNKKDDSMQKAQIQQSKTKGKKKDILKILDDLGSDQYDQDFQSYREDSQK